MQAHITIKAAAPVDIPLINKLAEATWHPTYKSILSEEQIDYMFNVIYTEESLLKQMQEGQIFLLLYADTQAMGFASYSEKDREEKSYKLNKIYLLPECQGKGYGKLLITAVEEEVKKKGATILDLNVNRYNNAKQFYEYCGYHMHKLEDIAIGPYWMNDYVMRKEL